MNVSTTPLRRRWPLLGCALLLALTAGCTSPSRSPSQIDRLIAHPEFKAAAQAAPHFTSDALKTIADLEARK